MATDTSGGPLYNIYRGRIGKPQTDDEVRGYWVFLLGLLLATAGMLVFLPSESADTLRETSIVLAAIGLAALVAGPVIRLPLQSWANYAAYVGQAVCFAAVVWFTTVFPSGWDLSTGSRPVIIVYSLGLAIILLGGVLAPLLAGGSRDLEESEGRAAELKQKLDAVTRERDELKSELEDATAASEDAESDHAAEIESLYSSQAQFELYEDSGGKYRWRLRHRNSNIIADSAQGYTAKHNAQKGLASVRRNALGASLLHVEPEPDEDPEEAVDDAPLIPEVKDESKADFEVYEDNEGKHRWRLVHDNGNVIADSGEGYASKRNATRAIESVRENAAAAEYLQFDPTSFEIYRDGAGEWRWRLVHKNGNILASASEGYTRRRDAKRSVESIRQGVDDGNFEVYEDGGGDHRWRLKAGNNEIIATAGEGYSSKSECERAVERVRKYGPDADALDVGVAAFEVYEDEGEEWRWRLRHRNGNVIADGGEGYAERTGVHDAIESVKKNSPGADVTER